VTLLPPPNSEKLFECSLPLSETMCYPLLKAFCQILPPPPFHSLSTWLRPTQVLNGIDFRPSAPLSFLVPARPLFHWITFTCCFPPSFRYDPSLQPGNAACFFTHRASPFPFFCHLLPFQLAVFCPCFFFFPQSLGFPATVSTACPVPYNERFHFDQIQSVLLDVL